MELLYFRADWCGVCHAKAPVAQRIARDGGLELRELDLDSPSGRRRADELRIKGVPTLALVDGERVRFRLVGSMITAENAARLAQLSGAAGSSDPQS